MKHGGSLNNGSENNTNLFQANYDYIFWDKKGEQGVLFHPVLMQVKLFICNIQR